MFEVSVKRIRKDVARRLFDEGKVIYIHPCKVSVYSAWMSPWAFFKGVDGDFDAIVNSYEFYNCDRERGYYAAFYIPE